MKTRTFIAADLYPLIAGIILATVGAGLGQPVITLQPRAQTAVVGTTATFTVAASGAEPLAYQWQKLSPTWLDMAGYTATNLRLTNVQTSHAGDYRVVVTNLGGAVTSSVARLTVLAPPPVPHHLTGITVLPDSTALLSLGGSVSNLFILTPSISSQFMQMFDLYPVEASTNLADWTRLALLLRTNNNPNPLLLKDTNAANLSLQFYRTPSNHLITAFPRPTGPFAVGTLSRILTDTSRSNRYGLPTNSSFMSTFWYPAEPPRAGSLPGPYTDRAVAADGRFYSNFNLPVSWTNVLPQCVAHSIPDWPVAPGTNRFPVILHSPGWTCDRRLNAQNAEELASHGYVVAAVDHEDCHATVYPDRRGVRYGWDYPGSQAMLFQSRTNDLVFLLQAMGQVEAGDPLLAGRLDLDNIGLMGFSLGGGTAAETARQDGRVKCVALLDPYIPSSATTLNNQGVQKPFLTMNGTIGDSPAGDLTSMSQRLYTLATNDATWLRIDHVGHWAFFDLAWTAAMANYANYSRPGAVAIDTCLLWFFDSYLKGQAPPFPTNSQIINVQRKP